MNRTFSLNNVAIDQQTAGAMQMQPTGANSVQIDASMNTMVEPMVANNRKASLTSSNSFMLKNSLGNNNNNNINNNGQTMGGQLVNAFTNDFNSPLVNHQKLSSKYASSNYLNELNSSKQMARATPRRRTPRNVEEYLVANGVVDTEKFLTKGYYVGSMMNLNEFASTNKSMMTIEMMNENHLSGNQSNQQQQQQHTSSSSSSSMNNQNGSLMRRNSITDGLHHHLNANKPRSATTAIVTPYNNNEGMSTISNGSSSAASTSAPVSDSSSSPTPIAKQTSHAAQSNGHRIGPLMSAVCKMNAELSKLTLDEHTNHHSSQLPQHQQANKYFSNNEDDYDDYEYLERNLGAEPEFTLNNNNNNNNHNHMIKHQHQQNDSNLTTNTNLTDYFTDESNSCSNNNQLNHHHHPNQLQHQHQHQQHQQTFSSASSTNNAAVYNWNQAHHLAPQHHHHQQQLYMQNQYHQHVVHHQAPTQQPVQHHNSSSSTSSNSLMQGLYFVDLAHST